MTSTSSGSTSGAGPGTVIVFTPQGLAALDRLAATLTAGCAGDTPAAIGGGLEQVLHAPLDDLARRPHPDPRVDRDPAARAPRHHRPGPHPGVTR